VNAFIDSLRRLGLARLAALAIVGAALMGFFGFFANKLSQPPMGLLYGDLSTNDAAQIVAKLDAQNIPYEIRGGGSQVWVPTDRALRLRMSMAEQGLPRGGSIGYELFDRADSLGATSFVQNLNLVRALEGELARSIASLGPISGARVHLVMPRRDLFARERQEPTASVAIKMRDAGRLPRPQVQAIQHLVAAAVPGLKPNRISVVDDRGNLLARGAAEGEENAAGTTAASADEIRRSTEQTLARKVEEQLERAVGAGKVRAEVAIEMDFDRIVTNSESFDPDGQVVRSQQTVSENNEANETAASQGVSVANNLPENEGAAPGGSQNRSRTTRQEETINYEITKTTRSHVREAGTIKRLSASIVVDGIVTAGADGKKTYQARNPEQMEQLKSLARAAIGFNERRGDALEIVNLAFAGTDALDQPIAEPGMFDFTRADLLRMAELGVLFIVSLLVILLVARPMISAIGKAATPPPAPAPGATQAIADQSGGPPAQLAAPAGEASAGEDAIDINRVDGRVKASSVKKVGEIVEKHPDEAVAILRNWMYQEA
jgi:flagellar M-ring protein FliF